MSKRIKVTVTQTDIKRGIRGDYEACPIARAINRAVPGAEATVGEDIIEWGGYMEMRCPPLKVQRFIRRFDTRKPVKPFTFCLVSRWR